MACPISILFLESGDVFKETFLTLFFQAVYQDFRFCSGQGCMCGVFATPIRVIAYLLRSISSCIPGYFHSSLLGFLVHLLALIKLHGNYPPVHELLNTSGAFGNYILITYLSSTLHSNFSLPKHTLN